MPRIYCCISCGLLRWYTLLPNNIRDRPQPLYLVAGRTTTPLLCAVTNGVGKVSHCVLEFIKVDYNESIPRCSKTQSSNVSGTGMGTTNEHPIENNNGYSTNNMEV